MASTNGEQLVGEFEHLARFTKSLKDKGVLDAPERLKALEERMGALTNAVELALVEGNAKHAKALRKVAEALVSKKVKRIKATKTGDDTWELEVESD